MNNKGFTMIELLAVLALVAIVSVSAVVVFDETSQNTNKNDLKNKYEEIQRASILFLDLNDSWINDFNENGEIYLRLGELQTKNYMTTSLRNPVTKVDIPSTYMVKVYVKKVGTNSYVNSCIIYIDTNQNNKELCVANEKGEYNNIELDEVTNKYVEKSSYTDIVYTDCCP